MAESIMTPADNALRAMFAGLGAAVERLASDAPVDLAELPADLAVKLELLRSAYEFVDSGQLNPASARVAYACRRFRELTTAADSTVPR